MHGEGLGNWAYGMWPILMYAYYRLSMKEEQDIVNQFGQEYIEYREHVPSFIPRTGKKEVIV